MKVTDLVTLQDPKKPNHKFPQAINHVLAGVPMRNIDWPQGRFVVLAPMKAGTDLDSPAMYVCEPDSDDAEPWIPSLADLNAQYEQFVLQVPPQN